MSTDWIDSQSPLCKYLKEQGVDWKYQHDVKEKSESRPIDLISFPSAYGNALGLVALLVLCNHVNDQLFLWIATSVFLIASLIVIPFVVEWFVRDHLLDQCDLALQRWSRHMR